MTEKREKERVHHGVDRRASGEIEENECRAHGAHGLCWPDSQPLRAGLSSVAPLALRESRDAERRERFEE